jgi:Fe-S cluster assembly protein SufD
MTTTTELGFDQSSFEALLDSRSEPDWLTTQRRAAWDHFQASDWPRPNHEEWTRTDIRLFKLDRFTWSIDSEPVSGSDQVSGLLAENVELAGQCASWNGRPQSAHLAEKWARRGVVFGSLEKLVREHGDKLRPYLMTRAVDPHYDRFAALHAAFWSGGTVLFVPRGVVVDEPLHSLAGMEDGSVDLGHTLVILEDGAEATLLSETAGADESAGGLHCGACELIVGQGAHMRFVNLQNWGQGTWHFSHQKAVLGQDAGLQWTIASIGARLAKVNQHVVLAGAGSHCQVNGVLFTQQKQHLSYHTLQHHVAPSCRSDFLYKSAQQDKSRTVWRGMIKVDSGAQQTNGYQRNDNLLLSESARADSIPGLEIEADDVRCTHGSTSGRVDEELIFYAQCRGFTRKEAIRMIVTGFFQQIFDRITIESVRTALGTAIARRVREYE